MEIGNWR